MDITRVKTNGTAKETGPYMHFMVKKYYRDMMPYAHLSLYEIYDLIKSIPYNPDPPDVETLQRPLYTMEYQTVAGDCDDKSIALASWAYINGYPYRFIAARKFDRNVLHHVYPELYIKNRWVPVDPTYAFNVLGRERDRYIEKVII